MPKTQFNIENPHMLHYQHDDIQVHVMGGLTAQSLSTLKVTLKAQKEQYFLRHTLDLYNNVEIDYYVQKLAEAIEIQTTKARDVVHGLTQQLEDYRQETTPTETLPTGSDKKQSLEFLQSKNLIEQTNTLIEEYGVVGETTNRLLMYLVFANCKQNHPLHIISYGHSGSGKSHLQNKVAELIPENYKLENTAISANALYYFHNNDLKNKVILVEDLDGTNDALYVLRELQTRGKVTKTIAHRDATGTTKAVQVTANGPITLAGCTTKEKLYEDNANRCFLITIDESKEQDKRIIAYQKKLAAGKVNESRKKEIRELFHNNMKLLQPVTIINPYAEYLDIPDTILKPRRTISHYLHAIEAVTYYHQFQREQKTRVTAYGLETYIESTIEDIEIANSLMKDVLLQKTDDLPLATRKYFEKLKQHLKTTNQNSFTNKSMMLQMRIPLGTIKRYHLQLEQSGYLQKTVQENKHVYTLSKQDNYGKLKSDVQNVLDANLLKIRNLSSSVTAQFNNEPLKPLIINKEAMLAQ